MSRKSFKESFDHIDRKMQRQKKKELREMKHTTHNYKNLRPEYLHDILDEENDDDEEFWDK